MRRRVSAMLRQERGQILMVAVLLVTALLGFLGLIVDAGFAYAQRRQAQNGADNAALAATRVLYEGGSESSARAAALDYAEANGYPAESVTVHIPPASGEHVGEPYYAEVTVEEEPATFFVHVLVPGGSSVRGRGVAGVTDFPKPYAVIALDPDDCDAFRQTGTADLTIVGGGVMINSDCASSALSKTGSGNLFAEGDIDVVGGSTISGSGVVSPAPRTVPWTTTDPLASISPPAVGSPSPTSPGTASTPQTLRILTPGSYALQPGTYYGGIEINCSGCTVTLASGVYVMAGGGFTKMGNPDISGDEVMIYLTDCNGPNDSAPCSGDGAAKPAKLAGGGTLELTPATSGDYEGITFWQDRKITDDFSINGDNTLVQGIFYAPGARLDLGGGTSLGTVQLVANTIRVSGNAPLSLSYGEFRPFESPEVTLVE